MFSNQCTPNINNSVLPTLNFLIDKRIDHVSTQNEEIFSLIRNLISTYPDMWKLANVTPIFKTGDKQLIKSYRPISPRSGHLQDIV